ncbi:tetratricopeptide repeat protein, partial [Acidobacteriota bacterium]
KSSVLPVFLGLVIGWEFIRNYSIGKPFEEYLHQAVNDRRAEGTIKLLLAVEGGEVQPRSCITARFSVSFQQPGFYHLFARVLPGHLNDLLTPGKHPNGQFSQRFRVVVKDRLSSGERARSLYRKAWQASSNQDLMTGIEFLDEALALLPNSATLWWARGHMLESAGNIEESLSSYKNALENYRKAPQDPLGISYRYTVEFERELNRKIDKLTSSESNNISPGLK